MKDALILSGIASSVAMVISLVLLLRGLYSLITSRCRVLGKEAKGSKGRTAGLFLAGQFIVGFVIYLMMFKAFDWGTSPYDYDSARKAVIEHFAEAAIFALASLIGYLMARSAVKGENETGSQPGEVKTS